MKYRCKICNHIITKKNNIQNYPKRCSMCKIDFPFLKRKNKCFICNRTYNNLHIHHKDGEHKNNIKTNLVEICNSCHAKIHFKVKSRNYGQVYLVISDKIKELKGYLNQQKELRETLNKIDINNKNSIFIIK